MTSAADTNGLVGPDELKAGDEFQLPGEIERWVVEGNLRRTTSRLVGDLWTVDVRSSGGQANTFTFTSKARLRLLRRVGE